MQGFRAVGDLELKAPFTVRSAFLLRRYERERFSGEMEGDESPLGPDRLSPEGNSFTFVFWKNMRNQTLWQTQRFGNLQQVVAVRSGGV